VALATREVLSEFGLTRFCKTSGGRGVHVFVRIKPDWGFDDVRHAAIAFGRELERRDKGVTTEWWKELRDSVPGGGGLRIWRGSRGAINESF